MIPLFTSMFLHGGWLHIIANMLYLWVFGDNVEDRLGGVRFLCFYLITGFCASAAHMIMNSDSTIPSVGASGAVAGVLAAYMLIFPHARVLTILPIFFFLQFFELPAFFFIAIWVLQQFLSGALSFTAVMTDSGGTAWWAHIGGFMAGLAIALLLRSIKSKLANAPAETTQAAPARRFYWPTSSPYASSSVQRGDI
jgi:membrane associated rhomboid family serine protease